MRGEKISNRDAPNISLTTLGRSERGARGLTSGRSERLISHALGEERAGSVIGIDVGVVLVSWVRRDCGGEEGEESEEGGEEEGETHHQ